MRKYFILTLFSIFTLSTYTSFSHSQQQNITFVSIPLIFPSIDSTIVPKDTISNSDFHLKGKVNRVSRYKNLEKEKERRKKIRAKYKREKSLKK